MVHSENQDEISQILTISDEQVIGIAHYGQKEGFPVFHFHGHGNSRLEGRLFHEIAKSLEIHLMSVDRPGYGLSTFKKRRLIDWSDDIQLISEALEIETFSVLGISGGAPHALAVHNKLSNKIYQTAAISTIGPPGLKSRTLPKQVRFIQFASRRLKWLYRMMLRKQFNIQTDPERFKAFVLKNKHRFSSADFQVMIRDEFAIAYTIMVTEGIRQGIKGAAFDTEVFSSPWGFELESISNFSNNLTFWHGKEDRGIEQVEEMAKITGSNLKLLDNEGHVSIFMNNMTEIFQSLRP